MRVSVDLDQCDSTGVCAAIAPDFFALDDDDRLLVRVDTIDAQHTAEVEEAVRSCPKLALSLRSGD